MNDPAFRQRLLATFQAEAAEHLQLMGAEADALAHTAGADDQLSRIERLFREVHTLKGAARMVGENDAEGLCHALEQRLSTWKTLGRPLAPGEAASLRQEVSDIARTLRVTSPLPAPPAELPSAPAAADRSAAAVAGIVRVPGARLDALLSRSEEIVSAKLTGDQHAAQLTTLSERGLAWRKEVERVRPDLAALRRFVDTGTVSPIGRELAALLHYVDWTNEYVRELGGDLTRLAARMRHDQRRLGVTLDQLLDDTKEVLLQPFSTLLEAFPSFVQQTARQHGKEIAVDLQGTSTEIDRRVLDEIRDALTHLVRNSVDHGIERPEERRAKGKPPQGRIGIAVQSRAGGNVEILVTDDGRGIDTREVTANARRLGLVAEDAPELPEPEALALLFRSGFSTRTEATDLSGHGLGLAIVREKVEQIGGSVSIESQPGRGTLFRLEVPLTLARFRGLFVSAQRHVFALPTAYVERVVRVRADAVRRVKNQELVELDGRTTVVLRLAEALGLAPNHGDATNADQPFLVLLQAGRARIALRVDEVPREEEVVMKNLGRLLRGARQYVGATLAGGGHIVPVLNISYLLDSALRRGGRQRVAAVAASRPAAARKKTVLVAEDSITSRSLLKGILQAAGYDVRTAVDGADALTILKFEPVDLVITDIQMPRLNGFELTARIRSDQALSTLPVILITSLASREDKERGVDAGANAYIVKSSFDQSDLLEAIGRLIP